MAFLYEPSKASGVQIRSSVGLAEVMAGDGGLTNEGGVASGRGIRGIGNTGVVAMGVGDGGVGWRGIVRLAENCCERLRVSLR